MGDGWIVLLALAVLALGGYLVSRWDERRMDARAAKKHPKREPAPEDDGPGNQVEPDPPKAPPGQWVGELVQRAEQEWVWTSPGGEESTFQGGADISFDSSELRVSVSLRDDQSELATVERAIFGKAKLSGVRCGLVGRPDVSLEDANLRIKPVEPTDRPHSDAGTSSLAKLLNPHVGYALMRYMDGPDADCELTIQIALDPPSFEALFEVLHIPGGVELSGRMNSEKLARPGRWRSWRQGGPGVFLIPDPGERSTDSVWAAGSLERLSVVSHPAVKKSPK